MMFGFWFVHKLIDRVIARFGVRYGIIERTDPAVLPIAVVVFSFFFLLATPVTNSIIRTAEKEADLYGLNSAREPHGFATAAMRLSTYRKIHPVEVGGNHLLRPSQRLRPRAFIDAVAAGKPGNRQDRSVKIRQGGPTGRLFSG